VNALNSVLIEGNVIASPEKRETPRGTTVCDFKIASSRFYRQDETIEEEKSVFGIESWAKLAESCAEHCTEGRGVRVVGRLKQCEDGSIKVVAEHVEFKPVLNN
jgi:single-strand DNA-binding protein